MLPQRAVTALQLVGAALGIPAAVAGSYSAYQNYFSSEATCQRLRASILATTGGPMHPHSASAANRGVMTAIKRMRASPQTDNQKPANTGAGEGNRTLGCSLGRLRGI